MLITIAGMLLPCAGSSQASDDFYAGKTVKLIIGTTVGGEYGLYARLVAQHIGKFLPGKPTVIVQTMPGGGGMVALGYLANIAPRDGTVIALPHVNIVQDGLLSRRIHFDPAQFQWIGRVAGLRQVGVGSSKSKVTSLEDAKERELIAGGSGANNPTSLNPRILNALVGTKFKIVTGYKSTSQVAIAWERGEVDVLTISWDLVTGRYGDQLKAGLITPLYVYANRRPPELAAVPSMTEFGRNDAERAFLEIYTIGAEIGRSLAAPPGVPAERVALWRAAFMTMLADSQFRQAAAKSNIRLEPLDGATLAANVAAVVSLPKDRITQAAAFYEQLLAEVR